MDCLLCHVVSHVSRHIKPERTVVIGLLTHTYGLLIWMSSNEIHGFSVIFFPLLGHRLLHTIILCPRHWPIIGMGMAWSALGAGPYFYFSYYTPSSFWPVDNIIVACIVACMRGMREASGFVSAISLHHFKLLQWSRSSEFISLWVLDLT